MGFANWNGFGCNYNDTTFRQQADFLVSSGMAAAVQSPSSQTSPPLPRPGPTLARSSSPAANRWHRVNCS